MDSVLGSTPEAFWYDLWVELHPSGTYGHCQKDCRNCWKVYQRMSGLVDRKVTNRQRNIESPSMASVYLSEALLQRLDKCTPAKCGKCSFTSVFRSVHEQIHCTQQDETKRLWCRYCRFSCDSLLHFQTHCTFHAENLEKCKIKLYNCTYCSCSFTQDNKIEDHIEEKHTGCVVEYDTEKLISVQISCPECLQIQPTEIHLLQHLESEHGGASTNNYFRELYSTDLKIVEIKTFSTGQSDTGLLGKSPEVPDCNLIMVESEGSEPESHKEAGGNILHNLGKCLPTQCEICSFTSEYRVLNTVHGLIHRTQKDETKRFWCKHCAYSCDTVTNFKLHSRGHTENQGKHQLRTFHCSYCDFVVNQTDLIDSHLEENHENCPEKYNTKQLVLTDIPCLECDKVFDNEISLLEHLNDEQVDCSITRYLRKMYGISSVDTLQGNVKDIPGESKEGHKSSVSMCIIIEKVKDGEKIRGTVERMDIGACNIEITDTLTTVATDTSSIQAMADCQDNVKDTPSVVPKSTQDHDHTKTEKYKKKTLKLKAGNATGKKKQGSVPAGTSAGASSDAQNVNSVVTHLKCKRCPYTTPPKGQMRMKQHVMKHINYRPYKCSHCAFSAIVPYDVKRHSRKEHPHNEPKVNTEIIKKKESLLKTQFRKVMKRTAKGKSPAAKQTGSQNSTRRGTLAGKKKSKLPTKPEQEPQPERSMAKSGRRHKQEAQEDESFLQCNHCEHTTPFKAGARMKRHVQSHLNYKPLRCPYCDDFSAIGSSEVKNHINTKHSGMEVHIVKKIDNDIENSLKDHYTVQKNKSKDSKSAASLDSVHKTKRSIKGKSGEGAQSKKPRLGLSNPKKMKKDVLSSALPPMNTSENEEEDDGELGESASKSSGSSGPTLCCKKCSYTTTNGQTRMLLHVVAKHTKYRPYKCPNVQCSYAAAQSSNVKKHISSKHPGQSQDVTEDRDPVMEEGLKSLWEEKTQSSNK